MAPYEPTVWQDRVVEQPRTYTVVNNPDGTITLTPTPGSVTQEGTPVNAFNLNKVEQGIKAAEDAIGPIQNALEALLRDQYDLHSELYYLGYHGGPEITGLSGMTWDGFKDTTRIDSSVTTASVSTSNMSVECLLSDDVYAFVTASNTTVGGYTDVADFVNVDHMIDGNANTTSTLTVGARAGTYWAMVRFDFGQARPIDTLVVTTQLSSNDYGNAAELNKIGYSSDGSSWTWLAISQDLWRGGKTTFEIGLGGVRTARYWAIQAVVTSNSNYAETLSIYNVEGRMVDQYRVSLLQSMVKSLDFVINDVRLFMSGSLPSGTSLAPEVSADGGTHWQAMIVGEGRTDPQFPTMTETEYNATFEYPGDQLVLRITLTPYPDVATPTIKRYGLYWL